MAKEENTTQEKKNQSSVKTAIRAGWIVGYQDGEHRIIRDGVVVFEGDTIVFVGSTWNGEAEETIYAPHGLVIPGFISTHAHISAFPGDRLVVDGGRRDLMRSGFLNYFPTKKTGGPSLTEKENAEASIRFGIAAHLRNGITTVVEGGNTADVGDIMVRVAREGGIRLYYSPGFASAEHFFDHKGRLLLEQNEKMGLDGLERAIEFIQRNHNTNDEKLKGILNPDEAFTSSVDLLHRTKEAAKTLNVGITFHLSEQLFEFHECVRRTGKTPVGFMADEGILGPEVILGHCVYVSGHKLSAYPFKGDLETLAETGSMVAHSPLTFARRGVALESFQRYFEHGINLSIGTDTWPSDILSEMQLASLACKIVESNHESAKAGDVFNAATLGGAKALGRKDLGRIAAGAKADIVIVDYNNLRVGPVHDPIRALLHCANGELVETVIVGGHIIVADRQLKVWNQEDILNSVRESNERSWESFSEYHWSGKDIDDIFEPSLPRWKETADDTEIEKLTE